MKSANTIANARQLLGTSVVPVIGSVRVDQTTTQRLEELFADMAARSYATSTIDRNWNYLNQALRHSQRERRTKTNPAADVLLPAIRPSQQHECFTIEQARVLLTEAIPAHSRPAMWLTGLMCGLRPGERGGDRWTCVDLDSDEPNIHGAERALEVDDKYVGQATPKTARSNRTIGLHPLLIAALARHRREQEQLGLYDPDGFVFCTRNGTPMTMSNMRRAFRSRPCGNALGSGTAGPPTSSATPSYPSSATSSTISSKSPTSPATSTPAPPRATATTSARAFPTPSTPGPASSPRATPTDSLRSPSHLSLPTRSQRPPR